MSIDSFVVWECNSCGGCNPCHLIVKESDGRPTRCPFGVTISVTCNFNIIDENEVNKNVKI